MILHSIHMHKTLYQYKFHEVKRKKNMSIGESKHKAFNAKNRQNINKSVYVFINNFCLKITFFLTLVYRMISPLIDLLDNYIYTKINPFCHIHFYMTTWTNLKKI